MVKVLISEDNHSKLESIVTFIKSLGVLEENILTATTLTEFSSKLGPDIGVCVIDIRIPAYHGAAPEQNGLGMLQLLESSSNGKVKLLAISAFPEEFDDIRSKFERQGCVLADYNNKDVWQNALRILILQSMAQVKFDFLIFVALQKERSPYLAFPELQGRAINRDGLTCYDIVLNGKTGSVIELPRMGLVDAAITAAKCIDKYSPVFVAMSGICAGFKGNAEMGQLLISELAYEYQTGKWVKDGFKAEPYQVPISERLRLQIRSSLDNGDVTLNLENGWRGSRPSSVTHPKVAIFTSGSAVIADKSFMNQVAERHRKVSGLDMEVYAIHRAAHLSRTTPDVLCAKVVVDLGDSKKDDSIQDYGCYVSARYVLESIKVYFAEER